MKWRSGLRYGIARLAFATAMVVLAGCGGDDDPLGPGDIDIVGVWKFQGSGDSSDGFTCTFTGITLTFARNGNTLNGSISGGSIACTPSGTGSFTGASPLDDIVLNGQHIEFSVLNSTGTWSVKGELADSGNSMSGTLTFPLTFSTGVKNFNGTWSATRS